MISEFIILILVLCVVSLIVFLIVSYISFSSAKKKRDISNYDLGRIGAVLELFPELKKRLMNDGTMSNFEWWGLLEIEERFNRKIS